MRVWLFVAILVPGITSSQDKPDGRILPVQVPSAKIVLPCKAGTNFEAEKYTIAHVSIDDPFKFLYWVNAKTKVVETELRNKLEHQLFTKELVGPRALDLIERARFIPAKGIGYSIRVEIASVQNCNPETKTLDLVYRIYSTEPPKFLGGAPESQAVLQKSPQNTTGMTANGSRFHLTPSGGYNRSYNLFAGGKLEATPLFRSSSPFDHFVAEGYGSSSMRDISAAISGSALFHTWVRHSDWRVNYANSSLPAGVTRLNKALLSAQGDIESRSFWNAGMTARFGGLLQCGNTQSTTLPKDMLPNNAIADAAIGSLKTYAGLSSRLSHNVFSVSFGMELGSVGPAAQVNWRKFIGDVVDEFWIPIGDHKPFEVESRFTTGGIQLLHNTPLSVFFFGGNGQSVFIPGDSWHILDSPYIRAIPANRFSLSSQGVGGTRFSSVNLTLSYPVKSIPVMPKELSEDKEFNDLLQGQIVTATSAEQNYYAWRDPHFAAVFAMLPDVKTKLDDLQKKVDAAQAQHPGQLDSEFTDCTTNIAVAAFYVSDSLSAKTSLQYNGASSLLTSAPGSPSSLQQVQDACIGGLNTKLQDPDITAAGSALAKSQQTIASEFTAIDQATAKRKAENDIAFVKRTLNTLFKDFNLLSVAPVAVLDVASIGPSGSNLGGTRVGPGAGIRVELVSSVNFTLGYAWNIDHHPGEGKGATFFSIGVRDIFH